MADVDQEVLAFMGKLDRIATAMEENNKVIREQSQAIYMLAAAIAEQEEDDNVDPLRSLSDPDPDDG